MTVRFRRYSWQLAPSAIREIRERVFVAEQRVPPALEWDDSDEIADHFLAVTSNNEPVATARLFTTLDETAHIGRMAVLKDHRGQGIGQAMLRHLMAYAAGQVQDLYLSAQDHAVAFYQNNGFHVFEGPYDDAGIPHFGMRCLAPELVTDSFSRSTSHPYPMVLGQDTHSWLPDNDDQLPGLTDSLAAQAKQRLWLYDRLLDHELYDRARLRDLLSSLARHHRNSEIRLLIHDDKPLVKRRHQIVELQQRLPSSIQLRLVNQDYSPEEFPFMLVDSEGVLLRHRFDRPQGVASFADPGRTRRLAESYQRMWDTARPSPELRLLS